MKPSEWEQDRARYYHVMAEAMRLRREKHPDAAAAANLWDKTRREVQRKYRGGRKCCMCQNFLPAASKALYCKPACKERAKVMKK